MQHQHNVQLGMNFVTGIPAVLTSQLALTVLVSLMLWQLSQFAKTFLIPPLSKVVLSIRHRSWSRIEIF